MIELATTNGKAVQQRSVREETIAVKHVHNVRLC